MKRQLDKQGILDILAEKRSILRERFHVKTIGLFGSFARNEAHPHSDIDVLVEFDISLELYLSNRLQLIDFLEQLFDRKVDLAHPQSLKPFYRERILKQAVYAP